MSLSHSELKSWFRYFNKKWFDGRLPADMDVLYAPDDTAHGLAIVRSATDRSISIDTALAGTRYAKLILLHEMNHHDTGEFGHGKRFQAGMLKLAIKGAFRNIW